MSTPADLINLCMDLNKPDFHVFLNFSGHAEPYYFTAHVIPGGYPGEAVYFQHLFTVEDIKEAIKWLTEENAKYRGQK